MQIDLRSTQVLKLWHQTSLAQVLDDAPDLTLRQITILLTIYLEQPPHTVRGLAAKLNVTKPVITRALNAMGALNLVDRKRDEKDKRNVIIQRTVEGALFLEKLEDIIGEQAEEIIKSNTG
ncbi:MAG: MarR family transcriptional regulator [Nitratireductor sp.]